MKKLDIKSIGLVTKPGSKEAIKKAEEIGYWLLGHQYSVYMLNSVEVTEGIGFQKVSERVMADDMDLLILFGGDGLVLYWGKRVRSSTKLIAVDFGHYGFITDINPPDATEDIGRILDGLYCTQDRYQLLAAHNYCGINVTYRAMNEVVLGMIGGTRLSPIRIEIGTTLLTEIHCTELLVATPTGSTAQSMSAGGPIVHPDLQCLIITPICPHTLNSRPIVIPAGHDITLTPSSDMLLSGDGFVAARHVKTGENVVVKLLTNEPVQTLHVHNDGFYTKLHGKMRWGERF